MSDTSTKRVLSGKCYSIAFGRSAPALFPEESHSTMQVCVPLAGAVARIKRWNESGSRRVRTFTADQILGFASWQPHEVDWKREASVVTMHVEQDSLVDLLGPGRHIDVLQQDNLCVQDACLTHLCQDLHDQAIANAHFPPEYLDAFITMLLFRLAGHGKSPTVASSQELTPEVIETLVENIDDNLDKKISVAELAQGVGMSVYKFIRKFKEEIGLPPYQYITSRRMERSCQLLLDSDCTILDVALAVGMSPTQFARVFAARHGLNPAEYRRAYKG